MEGQGRGLMKGRTAGGAEIGEGVGGVREGRGRGVDTGRWLDAGAVSCTGVH